MSRIRTRALLLLAAVTALAPSMLYAACTSPAGIEGEQIYNTDYATMQFCDGTNWISMAASGSATAEIDPKVGALTASNFCKSNAGSTQIVCSGGTAISLSTDVTGNLPITRLNSGTAASATTFWRGDGTWATAGAAASGISGSVQFSNGSGLSSDASTFFWDNTTKRLGIGTNAPGQSIETAGNVKSAQYLFAPQAGWAAPATVSGGSVGTLTSNAYCTANAASTQVVCATTAIPITSISATGTPSASTFLRGDGSWNAVSSSQWTTSGANIFYSAGNVGIGTTSPAALLDIPNRANIGTPGGRNYFKDAELATGTGLRVGAAWGMYGIYSEDGRVAVGGLNGISFQGGQMTLDTSGVLRFASLTDDCPSGWFCNIRAWDISVSSIYYSGMVQRSDVRLKTAIESIKGSAWLDKLYQLTPVKYEWKDKKVAKGPQFGFIAQEVEKVWPELVTTATDKMKTKSVNYINMISPLVEAVKELKTDNDSLRALHDADAKAMDDMRKEILAIKASLPASVQPSPPAAGAK